MSIISRVLNHFTPFKSDEDLWHGSLDEKKPEESAQVENTLSGTSTGRMTGASGNLTEVGRKDSQKLPAKSSTAKLAKEFKNEKS